MLVLNAMTSFSTFFLGRENSFSLAIWTWRYENKLDFLFTLLTFFLCFFQFAGLQIFQQSMMVHVFKCVCRTVQLHTYFFFSCNGQIVAWLGHLDSWELCYTRSQIQLHCFTRFENAFIIPINYLTFWSVFFIKELTLYRFTLMAPLPCQLVKEKLPLESFTVSTPLHLTDWCL